MTASPSPPRRRSPSPQNRSRSRSPPHRSDRERDNYRERDDRNRDSGRDSARRGGGRSYDRGSGNRWRGGRGGGRGWDRDRGDGRDDFRSRDRNRGGRGQRDSTADDYPYRRTNQNNRRDDDRQPRRGGRYNDDRGDRYRGANPSDSDRERAFRQNDRERDRYGNSPRRRDAQYEDDEGDVDLPSTEPRSKPKKSSGFKWKDEPPKSKSSSSKNKDPTVDASTGLAFTGPEKAKKKDQTAAPKGSTAIPKTGGSEEMIIVHVNDRLGTKAAIPCFASDRIKEFKIMVAARIGREPHEILLKRQGERPFKDQLSLEDYGVSNGVQVDLEVDTGD
ncbi:hypothetical protein MKZ38_006792 [Zalerion maritima]|uniref:Ubiquitin-like modifier HUB1 n=1 Tax=Zalerion maritima TaxID=339359 RepID=A0AAD5RWD0_9PEZI|nr:hypothetical protein MKZ38_006792 [Zalerion maritima]